MPFFNGCFFVSRMQLIEITTKSKNVKVGNSGTVDVGLGEVLLSIVTVCEALQSLVCPVKTYLKYSPKGVIPFEVLL